MKELKYDLQVMDALCRGAALVISISGGKDSDAMLKALMRERAYYGWTGEVIALHCDLGRAEHPETMARVRGQAEQYGIELVIVRKEKDGEHFDLIDEFNARRESMDAAGKEDKPHWASSAARYCTKHQKTQPTDKYIRQRWAKDAEVVVAIGLRAEESPARAKKPLVSERESTAPTLSRTVLDWHPIHEWTLEDVWAEIGYNLDELGAMQRDYQRHWDAKRFDLCKKMESVFKAHVAYLRGNERLSCVFCVLGGLRDLRNGARHNPDLYQDYVDDEIRTGFSFKNKLWLADIRPDLLRPEQREAIQNLKLSSSK